MSEKLYTEYADRVSNNFKWKDGIKMSSELKDKRKEEIIDACVKLYETKNFKNITITDISEFISVSRPSIYNYFQTKEEIFLELLRREYSLWIEELQTMIENHDSLTEEAFAKAIAKSMENRPKMLKLLSMNMYDIEENSRLERLVEFKKIFAKSMETIKQGLNKFFHYLTEEEKTDIIYAFFPFMYGVYPHTMATDKQKEAVKIIGFDYKYMSIYEITYKSLMRLLKK